MARAFDVYRVVIIIARSLFLLINELIRDVKCFLKKNCSNLKATITLQLIYRFFGFKYAESLHVVLRFSKNVAVSISC